jgi:hypothetical protein
MAIVRLEGLGQLKKIHLIGTRTRDLPKMNNSQVHQTTIIMISTGKSDINFFTLLSFSFYWGSANSSRGVRHTSRRAEPAHAHNKLASRLRLSGKLDIQGIFLLT